MVPAAQSQSSLQEWGLPMDSTFDLLGNQRPLGVKLRDLIFCVEEGTTGCPLLVCKGGLNLSFGPDSRF